MAHRSLQRVIELAEDVARAVDAIQRLKRGQNGAAVGQLVTSLEREVKRAAAVVRKRRRANRRRDRFGRFM